jgi:chorismate mutase / prephenate dehydrogenase
MSLDNLRTEIAETDEKIIEYVAKRMRLSKQVGQYKLENGLPIKAFDIEKQVVSRYLDVAQKNEVDADLTQDLARLLIDQSCKAQERLKFKNQTKQFKSTNSPGKAMVIGSLGHMGKWFKTFLSSFGYEIIGVDLKAESDTTSQTQPINKIPTLANTVDLVAICTPMSTVSEMIDLVAKTKTSALVFDISSLKTPVIQSLEKAKASLDNLVSIHPMFGPDVELLTGENILICDLGCKKATQMATDIFSKTSASLTITTAEEHDKLMGDVLGLSHLINLLFGKVLAQTTNEVNKLIGSKSTTFKNQLDVTGKVVSENPSLYYEIQSLNAFTPVLYDRVQKAFSEITQQISEKHPDKFSDSMQESNQFLSKLT